MPTKAQLLAENEELKKEIKELKEKNSRLLQLLISEGINPLWLEEGKHVSEEEYEEIYTYWLSLDLVKHKKLSLPIKRAIDNALSRYNMDDILDAMDNYAEVYHNTKYFFNQRWSLEEFLRQSNAMKDFMNNGTKWLNYIQWEQSNRTYF